jgi:hypothetical protein
MAKKYIDAEKIIVALRIMEKVHTEKAHGDPFEAAYAGTIAGIANAIDKLPAADVEPKWIPCSEKLPEEDYETGNGVQFSNDVLATIVNHANDGELYVWLLKTVDGKWYDYTPNEDGTHEIPYWCEVIAWMPLPEPYKGGEDGNLKPRYCDRNICTRNEYNGISCDECEVAKYHNLEDDDSPCRDCWVGE